MKTAFLGLGIMGYPMAGHLSKQFETLIWNRTNTKAESHSTQYGTHNISSFAELSTVDALFTCFPTSKEVLEGEWVKSEYGNPGVIIETPQVLKRTDLSEKLPKEGMALIKEMQSFIYGDLKNNFQLMVSTIKYKQEGEVDLAKSIDGSLQFLETQGAQNMIVKQEEFDTKEGVRGMKAYGTFSRIDGISKSSTKYYYEVLLFSQEGGLQQIAIVHEEGDAYANQISDRILNSVELKKVSE